MQPLSGNQRPNRLTSLMNMSFVLRLPRKMHLCRSSSNVPCLPSFLEMLQNLHVLLTFEQVQNPLRLPRETTSNLQKWSVHGEFCTFWLGNVLRATTACTFSTSQLSNVIRSWCVLYIFTSKSASRHNAVHFFNISTSKSAPNPSVFNTFYFQICFAPQRRALFQLLNFQKWSDADVFCTFSLRNRLRTTTACNFSSLISPDVSAPAALASLLFNLPEPQNHEKTQCFAAFLPFRAPASSFFWSFLFWLFSLLAAFSSLHIVGSLTSKLPSMIILW